MMRSIVVSACLAGALLSANPALAQEADLRAIFSAPISIEREDEAAVIPVDIRMGKLFIDASVNGETREFIFDTGSPTLITRAFADELGLEVLGQNTGVDAHGTPVTMDIAVAETLTLGGVTFRDVPVFIFDPSTLELGACVFDGGVVGSEIFPGSVWRIDTENRTLTVSPDVNSEDDAVIRTALLDFGYPHAPVIDYRTGDVSDRALFDTGNSEAVTLFSQVAQSPGVRSAMDPASVRQGRGIEGFSAGGASEVGELHRFTLVDFEIGGETITRLPGTTRRVPPTLAGAGLLSRYVVTLDYVNGEFRLAPRAAQERVPDYPGYALAYQDGAVRVVQLFDGSPADRAGLQLGDHVMAIDGRPTGISSENALCDAALWLADTIDPSAGAELTLDRDGVSVTLDIPASDG